MNNGIQLIYIVFLLLLCLLVLYIYNNIYNKKTIINLYWTGGYDSTFRLCQLIIDKKQWVQPIYISSVIDNDEQKETRRFSVQQELETMKKIIETLRTKYPTETKRLFDPLVIREKIKISPEIERCMYILYMQGKMRRPVCQYGGLSQYSLVSGLQIETSVEKDPINSMMYNTIYPHLKFSENDTGLVVGMVDENKIREEKDKCMLIFRNLKFGTINLTKKEMLEIAKENGYSDVLKMTWSCWYPENGKPCGKCIMCYDRVYNEKIEGIN